jgi:hypothetical protein
MGPRFRGDDDPLWRLLHNAGVLPWYRPEIASPAPIIVRIAWPSSRSVRRHSVKRSTVQQQQCVAVLVITGVPVAADIGRDMCSRPLSLRGA